MKKTNNKTTYIEVPETIYNSIPEGKCQVHVYDAEIVNNDKVKGIKLFCCDVDGNKGEYLIFYSNNASHVYGQLIRALSSKKVTKIELNKLIGKQLFVNIEEGKVYRNFTSIERVGKSDYFEVAEDEYGQEFEEEQDYEDSMDEELEDYEDYEDYELDTDDDTDADSDDDEPEERPVLARRNRR